MTSAAIPFTAVQRGPRVATSIDAALELRSDWLSLRERIDDVTPNTEPDRYLVSLRAFGADVRPYIAVFDEAGESVAAVIGRLCDRRMRHRIGYLPWSGPRLRTLEVAYGGLLASPAPGAVAAVCDHLERLLADAAVECVWINHIPVEQAMGRGIREHPGLARRVGPQEIEPHWTFSIVPGSYADTLQTFSRKTRKNVKREQRILSEAFGGDIRIEERRAPDEVDEIIRMGARITSQTYHAGIGNPFVDSAYWRGLLELEARRGALRAYFLVARGEPIAFYVGSVHRDALVFDATGYLPQFGRLSPGKQLLLAIVERCCGEGLRILDYGFGDAEYKRVYGTHHWDEAVLTLYGRGLRPRAARAMHRFATAARKFGVGVASRLGAVGKLRKIWRRRIQTSHDTEEPS